MPLKIGKDKGSLPNMASGLAVTILVIVISLFVIGELFGLLNLSANPLGTTIQDLFNKLVGSYNWFYILILASLAMAVIAVVAGRR